MIEMLKLLKLPKWLFQAVLMVALIMMAYGWYNANIKAEYNQDKYEVQVSKTTEYVNKLGQKVTENRVLVLRTNDLKKDSSNLAAKLRCIAKADGIKLKSIKSYSTGEAKGEWSADIVMKETITKHDSILVPVKEGVFYSPDSCISLNLQSINDTTKVKLGVNIPIDILTSMNFVDKWGWRNLSPFPWDWRKKQPVSNASSKCKDVQIFIHQLNVEK